MKVIGIIPARHESKRFPGKPLALIDGKLLIKHVYDKATDCSGFNYVCVVTGDIQIINELEKYNVNFFVSQKEHNCGTDRVREAAQSMKLKDDDIIVNIQGDQFSFYPMHILVLVQYLKFENEIVTLAVPKTKGINNKNTVKVVTDREDFALYFSRSPLCYLPHGEAYLKHIGIYGYRVGKLMGMPLFPTLLEQAERLEQLRWMERGHKIKVLRTGFDSHSIDIPEDLKGLNK